MNSTSGLARNGEQKIENSLEQLSSLDYSVLPLNFQEEIINFNSVIRDASSAKSLADMVDALPELLGVGDDQTYLILLADNARYSPSGGNVSAFAIVNLQNGSIADIRLQNINDVTFDISVLNDVYRDLANSRSFQSSGSSSFNYQDLQTISDFDDFALANKVLFEELLNRDIDSVLQLEHSGLEELISALTEINGERIELEGVEFDGANLLESLEVMQIEPTSVERRNDLSAQLFAKVVDSAAESIKDDYSGIVNVIVNLVETSQLRYSIFDAETDPLIADPVNVTNSDAFISVGFLSDRRIISPTKYPSTSIETVLTANDDSSFDFFTKVKFPTLDNLDELSVCINKGLTNLTVQAGTTASNYRISDGFKQKCVIFNITSESEVGLSWRLLPIVSTGVSEYNISVALQKQAGMALTSDFEIRSGAQVDVVSIDPVVNLEANQQILTDNIIKDQVINILFRNNNGENQI